MGRPLNLKGIIMKVICINAMREVETGGFIFPKKKLEKLSGLTEGRVYEVGAIPMPTALWKAIAGSHPFDTKDVRFLLYDDNDQWATYETSRFRPA